MTGIELQNIPGTRCFCDDEAAALARAIARRSELSDVRFIGSGDFHYFTLFELERIAEPFALLLFDNHSDAQEGAFGNGLLSCGNWVLQALKLPMCKGLFHPETAGDTPDIPQGLPIYVSIDLDALSPLYAETNWDQGVLNTEEICGILQYVAAEHRIIGADICGAPAGDTPSVLNDRAVKTFAGILSAYVNL